MAEIDSYDLRATLRAIHSGDLTADEAKGILDVTRRAAAADQRTDIGEMTMLLRLKDFVAQLAGEPDLPVTGKVEPVHRTRWSTGARELAFACAYLVMKQDLALTDEEQRAVVTLARELSIEDARRLDLCALIDQLVR